VTEMNLVQALNSGLRSALHEDESVLLLGEDIGRLGGVFRVTEGLRRDFGAERVLDTPLSETGIIGTAIGMALNGLRPVAEIQFADFIYPGFDQLVSEAAKYRYRTAGEFHVPMVVRTPYGGGIRGGQYHSQSPEALFIHTPGLKVVCPSNPYDAKGLLIEAIRDEDPIVFFEPKRVYRTVKADVSDDTDFVVRPGEASVVRQGADVALISYGASVHVCLEAAASAAEQGVEALVLDLRTLAPLDIQAILDAARTCGRVVVVSEAPRTCSVSSEISALIAEGAIDSLEAPILRVTGFDTPFPYALEPVYMPTPERVLAAIAQVLDH